MIGTFVAVVAIAMTTPADGPVPFRTVAKGTDSRVRTHHELVARTAGSWHVIWYEHTGTHQPPDIDFRRELIVAVFGGKRPDGDSLDIVSVTREGSSVVVRYREQAEVGVKAIGTPTMITPFHIIAIPGNPATVKFVALRAPSAN
jgi:hypothetical protein